VDDVNSATWSGLNIVLNNSPYEIQFWDLDIISGDDDLGTFSFSPSGAGVYAFNVAGGTEGTITVDQVLNATFSATDTIVVSAYPADPVIIISGNDTICQGETVVLDAGNQGSNLLQWFVDGVVMPGEDSSTLEVPQTGNYQLQVTNEAGCSVLSPSIYIFVAPLPVTPTFSINGNTLTCFLTGVDYQWLLNGTEIPGATSASYEIMQSGNYSVQVSNEFGCSAVSGSLYITFTSVYANEENRFHFYPNPVSDLLWVECPYEGTCIVSLSDLSGRQLWNQKSAEGSGEISVPVSQFLSGTYLLEVRQENFIGHGHILKW
jgi:hypothetical protein